MTRYILIIFTMLLIDTASSEPIKVAQIDGFFDIGLSVRIYELEHISAFTALINFRPILPPSACIKVEASKNLVVYCDYPDRMDKFENILKFIDTPKFVESYASHATSTKLVNLVTEFKENPFEGEKTLRSYDDKVMWLAFERKDPLAHYYHSAVKWWFPSCIYDRKLIYLDKGKSKALNLVAGKTVCLSKFNVLIGTLASYEKKYDSIKLSSIHLPHEIRKKFNGWK